MTRRNSNRMSREDDGLLQPVWRTGEPGGRGLYEQPGRRGTGKDEFLGLMETPELADHVVKLHNQVLE